MHVICDRVYARFVACAAKSWFRGVLGRLIAIDDRYHLAGLPHGDKRPILLAQQAQPCDPAVEDCEGLQEVSVTGSRVASKQSITNNQVAGVDEGATGAVMGLMVVSSGRTGS